MERWEENKIDCMYFLIYAYCNDKYCEGNFIRVFIVFFCLNICWINVRRTLRTLVEKN